MKQQIKNGIIHAVAFCITVWLISYAYGAYQSWSADVSSWSTLTATLWNKMQDNQTDFNTRITTLESATGWTTFTNLYESWNNIWIGISNPSTILDISGSASPIIKMTDSDDNVSIILQALGGWSNVGWMGTQSSHDLRIGTSASVKMTIQDSTGNVWIGTNSPWAELEVNGSIITDAMWYATQSSILPNDMSYSAWGYADGSTVTLDRWAYLVKYYMCDSQNTYTATNVQILSTSGTIHTSGTSYVHANPNGGNCWYYLTDMMKVESDTAVVKMRFWNYWSYNNVDNNPTANSVHANFYKIY